MSSYRAAGSRPGNSLPRNDPRAGLAELWGKRFVQQTGGETGRGKPMLTPDDAVWLSVMEHRLVELEMLKNEAETKDRADELQAQLDELVSDYDHVLQAVVLI